MEEIDGIISIISPHVKWQKMMEKGIQNEVQKFFKGPFGPVYSSALGPKISLNEYYLASFFVEKDELSSKVNVLLYIANNFVNFY